MQLERLSVVVAAALLLGACGSSPGQGASTSATTTSSGTTVAATLDAEKLTGILTGTSLPGGQTARVSDPSIVARASSAVAEAQERMASATVSPAECESQVKQAPPEDGVRVEGSTSDYGITLVSADAASLTSAAEVAQRAGDCPTITVSLDGRTQSLVHRPVTMDVPGRQVIAWRQSIEVPGSAPQESLYARTTVGTTMVLVAAYDANDVDGTRDVLAAYADALEAAQRD